MGNTVADLLGQYIEKMLFHHKSKRHKRDEGPEMPDSHKNAFHGGERALLYLMVQEFLENFGMDGKACLLRAICEVHAHPLKNYGFVGEIAKLFLSYVFLYQYNSTLNLFFFCDLKHNINIIALKTM